MTLTAYCILIMQQVCGMKGKLVHKGGGGGGGDGRRTCILVFYTCIIVKHSLLAVLTGSVTTVLQV